MDIKSACSQARTRVSNTTSTALYATLNGMRHSNIYRAAEFKLAKHTAVGTQADLRADVDFYFSSPFSVYDQDQFRSPIQRKTDLANASFCNAASFVEFINACEATQMQNPYVLHRLRKISTQLCGEKSSAETLRYIRRASAKLHPDKTADLNGWMEPGTVLGTGPFAPPKPPEHAKSGANNLFAIHQSLKKIHRNPYYEKALVRPASVLGSQLTIRQVARDFVFISAALLLVAAKKHHLIKTVVGVICGSYGALAALCVYTSFRSHLKKRRQDTCRELVLYKPQGAGQ